jgi:hypothetical protein
MSHPRLPITDLFGITKAAAADPFVPELDDETRGAIEMALRAGIQTQKKNPVQVALDPEVRASVKRHAAGLLFDEGNLIGALAIAAGSYPGSDLYDLRADIRAAQRAAEAPDAHARRDISILGLRLTTTWPGAEDGAAPEASDEADLADAVTKALMDADATAEGVAGSSEARGKLKLSIARALIEAENYTAARAIAEQVEDQTGRDLIILWARAGEMDADLLPALDGLRINLFETWPDYAPQRLTPMVSLDLDRRLRDAVRAEREVNADGDEKPSRIRPILTEVIQGLLDEGKYAEAVALSGRMPYVDPVKTLRTEARLRLGDPSLTPVLSAFGIDLSVLWPEAVRDALTVERAMSLEVYLREFLKAMPYPPMRIFANEGGRLRTMRLILESEDMPLDDYQLGVLCASFDQVPVHSAVLARFRDKHGLPALLESPAMPSAYRLEFVERAISESVEFALADHSVFLDELPDSVPDALSRLKLDLAASRNWDPLIKTLMNARGRDGESAEDLRHGLIWGNVATTYLTFLKRLATKLHVDERNGLVPNEAERQVMALSDEVDDLILEVDETVPANAKAEGRGLVLTRAHAGIGPVTQRTIRAIDMHHVGITGRNTSDDSSIGVGSESASLEFMKLVKRARKEQLAVTILPDGRFSADGRDVDLFGHTVTLGQGAAMLGYRARMQVCFVGTRWSGTNIQPYITQGPVVEDGMTREDYDEMFFEFYADRLRELVLGQPQDMSGVYGFWRFLQ